MMPEHQMIYISVIIPVYKVEKYLRRCLDSICRQTFKYFECITVDDGSPDNCSIICDEYSEKDKRFVAVHQKNSGTAHARDTGIRKSKGVFLVFVDGDDWIEENALELLFNKQRETSAKIVMGAYCSLTKQGKRYYYYPEIHADNALIYYFLNNCDTLWGKLYNRELFDTYIIPKINDGEDAIVNIQIFSKINIQEIVKIDNIVYNYDNLTNGISIRSKANISSLFLTRSFLSRLWIEQYIEKLNIYEQIKSAFNYHIITRVINTYLRFNKKIDKKEIKQCYEKYYKPCSYKKMIRMSYKILFQCFCISVNLGKFYRFFINKGAFASIYVIGKITSFIGQYRSIRHEY
jgi:glycosyltransferase involved in cell wall biosynthesis